jgi:UDP-GlcNAc3NAcA epimerase
VGYLESLALTRGAGAVVTDSGGLQREAYWMGTPCVTVRGETEWTETLDCGANRLVPPSTAKNTLAQVVVEQRLRWRSDLRWDNTAYGSGRAAAVVAEAVRALLAEHLP